MLNFLNPKYKCRRFYKVRQVTTNNKCGDSFAVTIPRSFAMEFMNVYFEVVPSGGNLILVSGVGYNSKEKK